LRNGDRADLSIALLEDANSSIIVEETSRKIRCEIREIERRRFHSTVTAPLAIFAMTPVLRPDQSASRVGLFQPPRIENQMTED